MSRIIQWVSVKIRVFVYSRFFLFCLGLIIGATGLFCTIQGREFYSDYLGFNGNGIAVAAVVHVAPQGDSAGLAGGEEGFGSPSLEEIVSKIEILESSGGRNNYSKCEAIGQHNRYGYGIYGDNYLCFEGDGDREAVKEWFAEKLENGLSLEAATCLYNTGSMDGHCDYYQDFISI